MNMFEQPLIGPFVERNGLTGGSHTGASITWTSAGNTFRLDLTRSPAQSIWSDKLGFAQAIDLHFEDFLWHCFEHNKRLPEFLNELAPFIRPSSGAPSPANAGQWLNPKLVAMGFSLGIAKVQKNQVIRIPVIWAFGNGVGDYGSRSEYARVDFIDWKPTETKLLRCYHYWGTGARALRRLLHESIENLAEPLLTEAGHARMRQLLSWCRPKITAVKSQCHSPSEKATALRLRQALHGFSDSLPAEFENEVTLLPEKTYAGLLRTCVQRNLPASARTLLRHRPLPVIGRQKLLERFIEVQWQNVWDVCAKEAFADLPNSRSGYDGLLHRVTDTGNIDLLRAVLDSIASINAQVAKFLLEQAFKLNRADMFNAVLEAPVVQPVRDKCLLECFTDCLFDFRQMQQLALYLLEIGVRPIQTIRPDAIFQPLYHLLEDYNFPVLKRALELEPPTPDSLKKLFKLGHLRQGEPLNFLISISRQHELHQERMDKMAFRAAISYINSGQQENITLLGLAFEEGGRLASTDFSDLKNDNPLTGYRWKEREGHWIDLIGHLTKSGRKEEAEMVKVFKRPRLKKLAASNSRALIKPMPEQP
jgi:hypothetical protein